MEIKAFFFDIDGTFYDHVTNQVLPQTLSAIDALKKQGYKVALCSGRTIEMAYQLHMIELYPWDGYVGGAGVSVYDKQMKPIYENFFSHNQVKEIFDLGKKYNVCIHSHGYYDFMSMALNEYSKQTFDEFHCEVPEVRNWNGEQLVALSAYEKKGYDWSSFSHIEGTELQFPNDTCVDFMKLDANKGLGIEKLMQYWGFDKHAYVAFGDSTNDIEMLQNAHIGIAMGNAKEDLKAHADMIIGPSNEPSIYETLVSLKFINKAL